MRPVLYKPDETEFKTNGIGILGDCISCLVTEERNGVYELEMKYPSNGMWSEDLEVGQIVKAKANEDDDDQLFTIYDIVRNLSGAYDIKAEHISYRLAGYPVKVYQATGAAAAVAGINTHTLSPTGFTFDTDITSSAVFKLETPRSVRSLLGGEEGSLLDVFHGEYHFDNFSVHYLQNRGQDNGVSIRYGKNLTNLEQDINGSVYNGIYPYWYREKEGLVAPSAATMAPGFSGIPCIEVMDLTQEFSKKPTATQLSNRAAQLVTGMGNPMESLDVSFVSLHQMKEYETISVLEKVGLCDYVHVVYPVLGIDVKTQVVKTVYNTLTERYESITLGSLQTTLGDIISSGLGDTITSIDDVISALGGCVTYDSFTIGSSITVGANASVTLTPNIDITKQGYHAVGSMNNRTNSGSCVVTRVTTNDEHTKIATCTVHNMTGSSSTINVKTTILYIREDLVV